MPKSYSLFVTTPKGMESLLAGELTRLGLARPRVVSAGVACRGHLADACRVCLWSRLASRVLLKLKEFTAENGEALYAGVRDFPWEDHLDPDSSLAVDFIGNSETIRHSLFGAQKVKDAVVDRLRARYGRRPSVDTRQPDLRINLRLRDQRATLSLDLSGDSLHRRGYRLQAGTAPLKENLAAAVLELADWPRLAVEGAPLLDPLCGSGTLLIEAAWMAADIAPGLLRAEHGAGFGFARWPGHPTDAWRELLQEARARREAGLARSPLIQGSDRDPDSLGFARANLRRAGLDEGPDLVSRELSQIRAPAGRGLLVTNPPYGARLGEEEALKPLYACLGEKLRGEFADWRAAIFTANPRLGGELGLRVAKSHSLYNGALHCRLLRVEPRESSPTPAPANRSTDHGGGQMFANRLRKNLKHLSRWARREGIDCYRLYDADLPEYAVAVDRYRQWVHVQEYAPPPGISPDKAARRLTEALAAIAEVLELPAENIFLKVRKPQKGAAQYQKQAHQNRFYQVSEHGACFLVNFTDYLDTGLFLDHRPIRARLRELARGKSFLNLFAYTGGATVHAALGGALGTTSVDMSATYLDWLRRNLECNQLQEGPRHRLIQADCLAWLKETPREKYDLIFLDPPTFSNSKRMSGTFDAQRDHLELIRWTVKHLAPDGLLIFSTNYRRFRLDETGLRELGLGCRDISATTLPEDFKRNPRVHQCWEIRFG